MLKVKGENGFYIPGWPVDVLTLQYFIFTLCLRNYEKSMYDIVPRGILEDTQNYTIKKIFSRKDINKTFFEG